MIDNDDLIIEDDTSEEDSTEHPSWKILIADDDEQVHLVTRLVLDKMQFEGKPLKCISTHSGLETREYLQKNEDVCVLLLDVVMETQDAGLQTARYIRQELQNSRLRIILRTGQPGQAPEQQVIDDYEINDYKEKAELTVGKLYTTVKSALRSYRDIITIEKSKHGLEKIIEASYPLFRQEKSLERFTSGVLEQLEALLQLDSSLMYVRNDSFAAFGTPTHFEIVSGRSGFANLTHKKIEEVLPPEILAKVYQVIASNESYYGDLEYIGLFRSNLGFVSVLYVRSSHPLTSFDKDLLRLYSTNISLSFDNIVLNQDIIDTQKEIVYSIGDLIETRSKETGNHVKRVAEYSILLARLTKLPYDDIELLANASPMHDVGKIGITDDVLLKPGKLTPEEFDIMKTHTSKGYAILANSRRKILQTAALIARDHHERWDGNGYPGGLRGQEVGIFARITAIADVFDALCHQRCYKEAWPAERVKKLFKEGQGTQFDPVLTGLFLDHIDEFYAIKSKYPDQ